MANRGFRFRCRKNSLSIQTSLALFLLFMFSPTAPAQVEYRGGPTMQGPITVFLIFWEPKPLFYDAGAGDTNYQTVIPQFFMDLGQSSYFNILTQYYGQCASNSSNSCVVPNTQGIVSVGGTLHDTRPYPLNTGTPQNPLQDSDIRGEVQLAITNQHWVPNINTEFFVYTTAGIQECNSNYGGGCTFQNAGATFCGYHDSFGSGPIIYAFIADPACISPSSSPNDPVIDSAVSATAHEFFESVSDPLGNHSDAWIDHAGEIGDRCSGTGPPTLSDGSDVSMFGHAYLVPMMFSNDTLQCVLTFGPTVQFTVATGDDDLRYDSSITATLTSPTGSLPGVPLKSLTQATWTDRSSQVRTFGISQTQLSGGTLTMAPGDGGHDEWKLAALDVRILDPLGNLLCDQDITANPGPLADLKNGATTETFSTPNCSTASPPAAWDSIEFQIRTGNDNAGDGTEVTATVPGQSVPFCLKPSTSSSLVDFTCPQNGSGATDQQGHSSWDNFTNSDQTFSLSPTESSSASFSTVTITLTNSSCCDNWDIEGISVTVFNSKGPTPPRTTLINIGNLTAGSSDDCLARLKTPSNATSATFGMDGSHVYSNGNESGTATGCKNNGDNP